MLFRSSSVLLILLLALIFCLLVYNGMLVKETAISTLLGHSKVRFVIGKFLNLLIVPFLISFITLNLLLCYLMKPGSFTTYYNAVSDIYKIVIVAMLIMAAIELVLLAVKVNFIKAIISSHPTLDKKCNNFLQTTVESLGLHRQLYDKLNLAPENLPTYKKRIPIH